jgi:hypothetical protein
VLVSIASRARCEELLWCDREDFEEMTHSARHTTTAVCIDMVVVLDFYSHVEVVWSPLKLLLEIWIQHNVSTRGQLSSAGVVVCG